MLSPTAWRGPEAVLLGMALASTLSFTTWRLLLDNFTVEVAQFGGDEIGALQSVREIPGFLSFSVIVILLIMGERTLALLSLALLGIGTAITGLFPSFGGLLFTTFVMSTGFHLFEAVNMSLSLQWLEKGRMPVVMGRIAGLVSVAALTVYCCVWLAQNLLGAGYAALYIAAGAATLLLVALVWRGSRTLPAPHAERSGFVLRKRYWLFYALTFMGGARRQIFVVFGGFLMVSLFGVDLGHMAGIYFTSHLATMFFAPRIGQLVSRVGERRALFVEYGGLIAIFTGYAWIALRGTAPFAVAGVEVPAWYVAAGFFVLDHLFFAFSVAIRSYFQRIAAPEDISATASISFSINHVAAVVLPVALGGLYTIAPYAVFLAGAGMALISLGLSLGVPRHPAPGHEFHWSEADNSAEAVPG